MLSQCSPASTLLWHHTEEYPYLRELGSIYSGSFALRSKGFPTAPKKCHLVELVKVPRSISALNVACALSHVLCMQYHFNVLRVRVGDGRSPPYRAVSGWLLEKIEHPVCDTQEAIEQHLKRAYESTKKKVNGSWRKSLSKLAIDTVLTGKLEEGCDFLETLVSIKPDSVSTSEVLKDASLSLGLLHAAALSLRC